MSPLQDPFYIVKEEIQESIDKLQATFRQWKQTPSNTGEGVHLTRELLTSCESIEWQVDELEKASTVASRDPAWYGLNEVELEKRRKWTRNAYNQVGTVKRTIEAGKEQSPVNSGVTRKELMRLPNDSASQAGRPHHYINQDNDDFISSESDQQQLLIKKQDEELDELSASVRRIGDVGLTIHDELIGQERILDELGMEMETTSNRLGFVQKSESYRKTTFVSAEKSCNGDEEGRCQGPNHVASILTCAIYSSFYVGIFHLKNNCRFAQPDALRYIVFLWIIFEILSGLQIPTSVRFI